MTEKITGKVLVCDDDETLRYVFKTALEQDGHDVTAVGNGIDAINFVKMSPHLYELCFLDMQMPIVDGRSTCRQLREIAGRDRLTIVLVTAQSNLSHEEFAEYYEDGFDAYIPKPIDITALCANTVIYLQDLRKRRQDC